MSRENVEIARRMTFPSDADWAPIFRDDDAWTRWAASVAPDLDPEFETAWIALGFRNEVKGLDGFRQGWLDFMEPWTHYWGSIVEKFIDVDSDRVATLARQRAHHEGTGAEVELFGTAVYHFRDGKLRLLEFYAERSEGLAAVGLPPQDPT